MITTKRFLSLLLTLCLVLSLPPYSALAEENDAGIGESTTRIETFSAAEADEAVSETMSNEEAESQSNEEFEAAPAPVTEQESVPAPSADQESATNQQQEPAQENELEPTAETTEETTPEQSVKPPAEAPTEAASEQSTDPTAEQSTESAEESDRTPIEESVTAAAENPALQSETLSSEEDLSEQDDKGEMTWSDLQDAFSEGGNIVLSNSVTAPNGASALTVTKGVTVTLDLNDCAIDRALTETKDNGSVIIVSGDLIVTDSSEGRNGTIKGGKTTGDGGGIRVEKSGRFVFEGGTVCDNYADNDGGGVYVSGDDSSFELDGGTVCNNHAENNGGGIAQEESGNIYIQSGSVTGNIAAGNGGGIWFGGGSFTALNIDGGEISGNTAAEKGGGVFINSGKCIMTDGSITGNTANIGGGVFINFGALDWTAGTIRDNTAETDPDVSAANDSSLPAFSIMVSDSSGGTVTADSDSAKYRQTVTLTVTPDEGYVIKSLSVTDINGDPVTVKNNTFIMPRSDVTVTAVFAPPEFYYLECEGSLENGTVHLPDYKCLAGETVTVTAEPESERVTASLTVMMDDEDHPSAYTHEVPGVSHPDPDTIIFTMPSANVMVYATFSDQYEKRVFICDMDGGTVIADKNIANYDDTITLTIRPDNGYAYVPGSLNVTEVSPFGSTGELQVDEVTENSVYTFEMRTDNAYISAEFTKEPEQAKYSVIVDDEIEYGAVTADYELAEAGWRVGLTPVVDEDAQPLGYVLERLCVTDTNGNPIETTSDGGKYEFIMPESDVFVTAVFAIPAYEIKTSAVGGEINADEEAEYGDLVSVWFAMPLNSYLESITVTGKITGDEYPIDLSHHGDGSNVYFYTFIMPGEPVTVRAVFSYISYSIAVDPAVKGSMTFSINGGEPSENTSAKVYDEVKVIYTYENEPGTPLESVSRMTSTYTTPSGKTPTVSLANLTEDGNVYTATFTMPESNVVIGAEYDDPYKITIDEEQIEAQQAHIYASARRAKEGDEITLYVYSDLSHDLLADWHITYEDAEGTTNAVPVQEDSNNTYKFIMPAAHVTVRADLTPIGAYYVERGWDRDKEEVYVVTGKPQRRNCYNVTAETETLTGWNYVSEDTTCANRLTVSGTAHLIIADGATLNCPKGIRLTEYNRLYIYGQENDSGKLVINGVKKYQAGIGTNDQDDGGDNDWAGSLIIHGCDVNVKGGSDGAGIGGGNEAGGGKIEIYGGAVTATGGGDASGIGSGDEPEDDNSRFGLTVYGGDVIANGSSYGAGIGGGDDADGGTVTILGGKIEATGGKNGAGIGGGEDGNGGTVKITGGLVMAKGGHRGAGIGGGAEGRYEIISILGGEVIVTGGDGAAGIGGGWCGNDEEVDETSQITIENATVIAEGGQYAAGIGGDHNDGGYWYGKMGNIFIRSGTVRALGGVGGAGIGTGLKGVGGGQVVIDGGNVTAVGGTCSAAIGCAVFASSAHVLVRINGGTVYALGGNENARGDYNAAIGRGNTNKSVNGSSTVEINGGSITALSRCSGHTAIYKPVISDAVTIRAGHSADDLHQVKANERYDACDAMDYEIVVAEECSHQESTFTVTEETHLQHCDYCLTKFTKDPHAMDSGNTCTVCGYQGPAVTIRGVTGSFNEKIKLNYYFDIPEKLKDVASYVTITKGGSGDGSGQSIELPVQGAEYDADKQGYKFSVPLVAKEASDTITARVFDAQGNPLAIRGDLRGGNYTDTGVQYTLMQYFNWLATSGETDNEKALGAAAQDYCAAAQIYFDYNADGVSVSDALDAVTAETLSGYVAGRSGTLPGGVSIKGISAMLESDNTIRLYFGFKGVDPAGLTYAIDGNPVSLKQRSDNAYYLALDTGVYSNHLQDTHRYSVSDGTNTYTITASVLTYARSCAIKSKEAEINLGKALYLYNRAAVKRFGN